MIPSPKEAFELLYERQTQLIKEENYGHIS